MTSRIFPFDASSLPDFLYLDTSYVWELHGTRADPTRSRACRTFYGRIQTEQVIMILNSIVLLELRHIILRAIYRQEAASRGVDWRQLLRMDKSFVPIAIAEVRRVETLLASDPLIVILDANITADIYETALQVMETYGVDATDAYHVALARQEEINSFVTLDQDFGQIGNLNLFTCDAVLLRSRTTDTTLLPFSPTV